MSAAKNQKALVACVGNSLVGDDAVGCAVFERLQQKSLPEGTRLIELGLGGLSLLDHLAGEKALIIVDAVNFGANPGSVHLLDWEDIPRANGAAVSVHGIGIRETIDIGNMLNPDTMPSKILLIGIEGRRFDQIGVAMTPAVAMAVDSAVREVIDQLSPA